MGEYIDESKLKSEIYEIMKKYFSGFPKISHDVAQDFSQKELEDFIGEYYNYLLK